MENIPDALVRRQVTISRRLEDARRSLADAAVLDETELSRGGACGDGGVAGSGENSSVGVRTCVGERYRANHTVNNGNLAVSREGVWDVGREQSTSNKRART